MRKQQPKGLQELSSTAMATHIANMCISLLEHIEAHRQDVAISEQTELMNSIYEGLRSTVTSKVPPSMADKLTNLWLAYMDWSFKTSKLKFTKESDTALLQIIRGIVHPRITYLYYTSAKIQTMLLRNLDVMERLEHLQVLGVDDTMLQCLVNNISSLKQLVSLHIHFSCTNELLRLIGDSCPNIADLDIFGSLTVNDDSVPDIVKLSHLTALDIFGTSISVKGSEKLIQALNERGNNLIKLGCSNFEDKTLEILCQHKSSLRFLRFAADLYDMFALTSFIHLKAIMFHCVSFCSLKTSLSVIGGNLDHLELHGVSRVDVNYIGLCCPHLVRFEMHNCTYSPWTHLQLSQSLPTFTALKVLKIHLMSKYPMLSHMDNLILLKILNNAHDIRHLSIATYSNVDRGFIIILLAVNPLYKLEEFNLGSTSETLIDPGTLLKALQNCENLFRVTVNGIEIARRPSCLLHLKLQNTFLTAA